MLESTWSDEAVLAVLCDALSEVLEKPVVELHPDMLLQAQLGMDSMAMVELAACLEDRFDRQMPRLEELATNDVKTVRDLLLMARRILEEGKSMGLRGADPGSGVRA
jgi:acyl carrier protein